MSSQNNDLENFDAFLSGQLSEAEAEQFMKKLSLDPEMSKAFAMHKSMLATIKRSGRRDLKGELKTIHAEKPRLIAASGKNNWRRRIPWLAAASVLLLVMAIWFVNRPLSNQQLATNYFEPYSLSGDLRGEQGNTNLANLSNLYFNKNYSSAIPLMQEHLQRQPDDQEVRLALAISMFENENIDQAQQELEIIRASGDSYFMDHANWYTALFALEKNDAATAISHLKLLTAEADADHYAEAKKLLTELE